jgi:hypothetical protein
VRLAHPVLGRVENSLPALRTPEVQRHASHCSSRNLLTTQRPPSVEFLYGSAA